MRAGITFSVDVDLKIGALAETITVTGDSPMIETGRPTSVLNIDGDLVRAAPITSRRLFSDALDLAPGVGSRNVDDGVGRRAYYFRGSHIYAHAFQLEGAPASAYIDSAAHSMGMGGDTVQDVEIKLGGADASTPLSTGVVMNVVTPRGQNQFKGSLSYSYQPLSWNGDNTKGGAAPGGLPTFQEVNQWDVSLGGRIIRDKVWFFGTYRYADLKNGISRTDQDLAYLRAFRPDFEPFDNFSVSKQPYVKVTTQVGKHELSGFWQYDRNQFSSNRERDTHQINPRGAGGSMYLVKLNSVWGNNVQTSFSGVLQQQGRQRRRHLRELPGLRTVDQRASEHRHLRRRADRQRHPGDDEQRRDAEHHAVIDVDGARRPHLLQDRLGRIARIEDRHLGARRRCRATCSAVPLNDGFKLERVRADRSEQSGGRHAAVHAAHHVARSKS